MSSRKDQYKKFLGNRDCMKGVLGTILSVRLESETGFTYNLDKYKISVDFPENNGCHVTVETDSRSLEKDFPIYEEDIDIDWAKVFRSSISVVRELDGI